jgi:amidase
VILCSAVYGTAPLHDTFRYLGWTSQWNLLDYPSLVFPVTSVDQKKDSKDEGYIPMDEQDTYNYEL